MYMVTVDVFLGSKPDDIIRAGTIGKFNYVNQKGLVSLSLHGDGRSIWFAQEQVRLLPPGRLKQSLIVLPDRRIAAGTTVYELYRSGKMLLVVLPNFEKVWVNDKCLDIEVTPPQDLIKSMETRARDQHFSTTQSQEASDEWSAQVRAKVGSKSVHKSPARKQPIKIYYNDED